MKKIKRKDGYIYILERDDVCPPDAICLLEKEYEWAKKISTQFTHDPEALKSFWETLFEKKMQIPGYLIFQDIPLNEEKEEQDAEHLKSTRPLTSKELAMKYCPQILETLKGRREAENK